MACRLWPRSVEQLCSSFEPSILRLILLRLSPGAVLGFALFFGGANGMVTIIRGSAVADSLWNEGFGAIYGLLAFPSNVARARRSLRRCSALDGYRRL